MPTGRSNATLSRRTPREGRTLQTLHGDHTNTAGFDVPHLRRLEFARRTFGWCRGPGSHDACIRVQPPAGGAAPVIPWTIRYRRRAEADEGPVPARQSTYLKIMRIKPITAAEILAQRNRKSVDPHAHGV